MVYQMEHLKDTDLHSEKETVVLRSADMTLEELQELIPGCQIESFDSVDDLREYAKQFKHQKAK